MTARFVVSLTLGVLLSAALPVHAQSNKIGVRARYLGDIAESTVHSVEAAFRRKTAVLSESTKEQPSALELGTLFPVHGFAPPSNTNVNWSLTGLTADTAKLCVAMTVSSVTDWNRLLSRLHHMGMKPADSACEEVTNFGLAPALPATLRAIRVLDRRDTPVPTQLSAYPGIAGADAQAVTRPGLILQAGTPVTLTVSNPFTLVNPGPPPVGLTVGLTAWSARAGFSVSHNCAAIAPNATCAISVQYTGGHGNSYPGSLRLEFSNGAVAVVGLLGTAP